MNSPWINYHHLFYFKTIAEEGTVSKAAEKLNIGQPTLSAQLKQFEDTLGLQLFERQHKKLILTEQGKIALDYAKNIFKMGSEMYEVLQDRLKPTKPYLHLATLDSISKQIVLKLVQSAFKISPCQITLSEGRSDELVRELTAHRVDLMITNFLPSGIDAKNLYARSLTRREVSLYAAPKFKSLKKDFPKSISDQPIILPTYDSKMRQDIEHWAQLNQISLNIITESQDISVKKLMAVNDLGLIPMTAHSIEEQLKKGQLIEIGTMKGVTEELFLLSGKRRIENPIASKLIKTFSL